MVTERSDQGPERSYTFTLTSVEAGKLMRVGPAAVSAMAARGFLLRRVNRWGRGFLYSQEQIEERLQEKEERAEAGHVRHRARTAAWGRAAVRLVNKYRDEFEVYRAEELKKLLELPADSDSSDTSAFEE